ncbi:MAG: hypothetical protein IM638_00655 [Bacteroidetes bacterium]|nr:hypothetical protein [Bacteroidota bacterium]
MKKSCFILIAFIGALYSCNTSKIKSVYKLEVNGNPEQVKEVNSALLKRMNAIEAGNEKMATRTEGNLIFLEFLSSDTGAVHKKRLRECIQQQGELVLSETYAATKFLSTYLEDYDTNDTLKAFFTRLFTLMTPYQPQEQYNQGEYPLLGFVHLKDTAKLNLMLNDSLKLFRFSLPVRAEFTSVYDDPNLCQVVLISTSSAATIHPKTTEVTHSTQGGLPGIELKFTQAYTTLWREMTTRNTGREIAILIDGQLFAFPTVMNPITNGRCSFNLNSHEQAALLTVILANPYPCSVAIIEENHQSNTGK